MIQRKRSTSPGHSSRNPHSQISVWRQTAAWKNAVRPDEAPPGDRRHQLNVGVGTKKQLWPPQLLRLCSRGAGGRLKGKQSRGWVTSGTIKLRRAVMRRMTRGTMSKRTSLRRTARATKGKIRLDGIPGTKRDWDNNRAKEATNTWMELKSRCEPSVEEHERRLSVIRPPTSN
jgi:hypothetical protein